MRRDVREWGRRAELRNGDELPGLSKEVRSNMLTITGVSRVEAKRNEHGYTVRERRYHRFPCAIPLPRGFKGCLPLISLACGIRCSCLGDYERDVDGEWHIDYDFPRTIP